MKVITSDDLIPIDENFRIIAGPGAGKTHWLINHIINVQNNSSRLKGSKKIACITYTNVGVDIVGKRLGDNTSVDVMTIHGFLYTNILKPYANFLDDKYCLDAKRIDGHDEPTMHRHETKLWLENHPKRRNLKSPFSLNQLIKMPHNLMALCNWLMTMKVAINKEDITFSCDNKKAVYYKYSGDEIERTSINYATLNTLKSHIIQYKKLLWKRGIVDHEDVLFLSYLLVKENPFILDVIRSKYPYFFVDEYQDTNPIQTRLLKMISNNEVSMGVIGDEAQSIFGFQGADVNLFFKDIVNDTRAYIIKDNRRSTINIVGTLNTIRTSISQNSIRKVEGTIPTIIIGDKKNALQKAKEIIGTDKIQSLSRDNITSNLLRREDDDFEYDSKILDRIYSVDGPSSSNKYRSLNIIRCVQSVELARQNKYKDAISNMKKVLKNTSEKEHLNREAVISLKLLVNRYEEYRHSKLLDFINIVRSNICTDMSNLRKGKPKSLYESIEYKKVAVCINIVEDISLSKTVHKAKGEEFDNVLLVLKKEDDIDFILESDLADNEEHRIYYVGISRARDNLFINVPNLTKKKQVILSKGFGIVEV